MPGGSRYVVDVTDGLFVEGAYYSLSKSWIMDQGVRTILVNGYGIKICNKSLTDIEHGRDEGGQNLGVAVHEIGGLLRLNMKFTGK